MIDIQNQPDFRNIPIDKVGIKELKYPVKVRDKSKGFQSTVAKISMFVDLPHQLKGTHMSRFVEMLNAFKEQVSLET
ncbi:MAG: GTP cyclohydrolase I FolE2, partial [Desulfobulbaceae bacterium]|nr:GTP cyclohydrolase I FolE2 [Desulfobulbaceae bacterium]